MATSNSDTYCFTCQKPLTGPIPAADHYRSQDHQKRHAKEAELQNNPADFYCQICKLACNSERSLQEHYTSVRHREKEKRARYVSNAGSGGDGNGEQFHFDARMERGECYACGIELTSRSHAQQHLNGEKHQKKVNQLLPNKSTSCGLSCSICKINVTGPESMEQHLRSEKHLKRVALTSTASICDSTLEFSAKESSKMDIPPWTNSNIVSVEEIQNLLSGGHSLPTLNTSNPIEDQNDQNSFCKICQVSFTGPSSAQQHFESEKHMKRKLLPKMNINMQHVSGSLSNPSQGLFGKGLESPQSTGVRITRSDSNNKQEYSFNGSTGFCYICNIQLTSIPHAEQHLAGSKHSKAHSIRQCNIVPGIPNNNIKARSPTKNESRNTEDNSYVFSNGRGRCYVCDIELSSPMHANQHLSGSKHQKAKARLDDSMAGQEYPLYCEICMAGFTGQESAKQHFVSTKHIKKAEIKMGRNAGEADAFWGNQLPLHMNAYDKTCWKFCEICQCPLNSLDQLQIHEQSPKHKAQKLRRENHSSFTISERSSSSSRDDEQELEFNFNQLTIQQEKEQIHREYEQKFQQINQDKEKRLNILAVKAHNTAGGSKIPSVLATFQREVPLPFRMNPHIESLRDPDETLVVSDPKRSPLQQSNQTGTPAQLFKPSNDPPGNHHHLSRTPFKTVMPSTSENVESRSLASSYDDDESIDNTPNSNLMGKSKLSKFNPLKNKNTSHSRDNFDLNEINIPSQVPVKQEPCCDDGSDALSIDTISSTVGDSENVSNSCPSLDTMSTVATVPKRTVHLPQRENIKPTKSKFHKFYCEICQRPMNTEKSLQEHKEGQLHKQKVATMKAPDCPSLYGQIIKRDVEEKLIDMASKLTSKSTPRSYQVDLFMKALQSDRVCFLPTGTGKTLVGVMTISYMLRLNPKRPVLFLVDKTLLVMQQAKYIYKELSDKLYERPKAEEEVSFDLVKRKLHIAVLCGGLQKTEMIPLWRHDIIITTAAFCQNLLDQEIINWKDFSLVVMDEVHHCIKNHPYCNLMMNYHKKANARQRPKVLGLTASPAGKNTLDETVEMLNTLLMNLGDAEMAITEKPNDLEDLRKYQSSAQLKIFCEPQSKEEENFVLLLRMQVFECYNKLCQLTDLGQKNVTGFADIVGRTVEEKVKKLDEDAIEIFTYALDTLNRKSDIDAYTLDMLRVYTKEILQALSDLETGSIAFALPDLIKFRDPSKENNFKFAKDLGLQCEELEKAIAQWKSAEEVRSGCADDSSMHMTSFRQLLNTLSHPDIINWKSEGSMALVLVQKRAVAKRLSAVLQRSETITNLNLKVTHLVGHGISGASDGMKVQKQKQTLDAIKRKEFDIVVATSIAEEGVDIPECQLVVCLNPPSNVTALVQMRGRARKKGSYFVVICNSANKRDKIDSLIGREENMMKAAEIIVAQSRKS